MVAAVVRKISARWEVELAEAAAAVRYGLMIAKGLSLNNIMVECDASNVVRSLKSRSEGLSPLMLVHDDNNRLRDDFESFSCFHRIRIAIKFRVDSSGQDCLFLLLGRLMTNDKSASTCFTAFVI